MVCFTVFLQIRLVINPTPKTPVVILSRVNTSTCQRTRYKTFKSFVIAKHVLNNKKIQSSTNANQFFILFFSFENYFFHFIMLVLPFRSRHCTSCESYDLACQRFHFTYFISNNIWFQSKLNANYLNPVIQFPFSVSSIKKKYDFLSTLFWDNTRQCTLC